VGYTSPGRQRCRTFSRRGKAPVLKRPRRPPSRKSLARPIPRGLRTARPPGTGAQSSRRELSLSRQTMVALRPSFPTASSKSRRRSVIRNGSDRLTSCLRSQIRPGFFPRRVMLNNGSCVAPDALRSPLIGPRAPRSGRHPDILPRDAPPCRVIGAASPTTEDYTTLSATRVKRKRNKLRTLQISESAGAGLTTTRQDVKIGRSPSPGG
jgi:hypothetical protein